jgi:hypothetical protein
MKEQSETVLVTTTTGWRQSKFVTYIETQISESRNVCVRACVDEYFYL